MYARLVFALCCLTALFVVPQTGLSQDELSDEEYWELLDEIFTDDAIYPGPVASGICTDLSVDDIPVWEPKNGFGRPIINIHMTQDYNNYWAERNGYHDGVDMRDPRQRGIEGRNWIQSVSGGVVIVSEFHGTQTSGWGESIIVALRPNRYSSEIITFHYHHMFNNGLDDTTPGYKSTRRTGTCELVEVGERVGVLGNTGSSTNAHLHFGARRWENLDELNVAINSRSVYGNGYTTQQGLKKHLHSLRLVGSTYKDLEGENPPHEWAYEYAQQMRAEGIEFGLYTGDFGTGVAVKRSEAARWMKVAAKLFDRIPNEPTFTDVPLESSDSRYVEALVEHPTNGPTVINSNGGCAGEGIPEFCPDRTLTRAQAIKMIILNFYGDQFAEFFTEQFWFSPRQEAIRYFADYLFDDVDYESWYAPYVLFGVLQGIVASESRNFNPNSEVIRAEMAKWIVLGLLNIQELEEIACPICDENQYCDISAEECVSYPECISNSDTVCEVGGGYNPCESDTACVPGDIERRLCPDPNEEETRECEESCSWSDWSGCSDCQPETCSSLGVECGSWPDGCGREVFCSDCSEQESCNGEGMCVADCQPSICTELNKECGRWPAGCEQTVDCGTCPEHQVCSSGTCVDDCLPSTCGDLGRECGSWDAGCEQTVNCGGCPNGQSCDNEGVCVEDTPELVAIDASCDSHERGTQTTCYLNGRNFNPNDNGGNAHIDCFSVSSWQVESTTRIAIQGTWICNCELGQKNAAYVNSSNQRATWRNAISTVLGPIAVTEWWPHSAQEDTENLQLGFNGCNFGNSPKISFGGVEVFNERLENEDQALAEGNVVGAHGSRQVCVAKYPNALEGRDKWCCQNCFQIERGVCVPETCSSLGKECGSWSDQCNGTLNCGDCDGNENCQNGRCICSPDTCADLGYECGNWPNGCDGTLNCGGCGRDQFCNNNGTCEDEEVPLPEGTTATCDSYERGTSTTCYLNGRNFNRNDRGGNAWIDCFEIDNWEVDSTTRIVLEGTWVCNCELGEKDGEYVDSEGNRAYWRDGDIRTVLGPIAVTEWWPRSAREGARNIDMGFNGCNFGDNPVLFLGGVRTSSQWLENEDQALGRGDVEAGPGRRQVCVAKYPNAREGRDKWCCQSCFEIY